jgi:hypothetical protein
MEKRAKPWLGFLRETIVKKFLVAMLIATPRVRRPREGGRAEW